ncbi:MAG: hypothetical protein L0H93_02725 [Nocardioides sp.]|nr:hypothetical protein [Nocardioides sp.]
MSQTSYAQLEAATYIPTSSNEIVVKGGALEGFSLLIEDPERRGLIGHLVDAVGAGATIEELLSALAVRGHHLAEEDLDDILTHLVEAGALKKTGDGEGAANAAWQGFVRYGELPPPDLLSTVHVVTSEPTEDILASAQSLGVPVEVFTPDAYDWAAPEPVLHLGLDSTRTELLGVNQEAVNAGRPVLYASMDLVDYRVGPYVVPGKTACMWETERQWARSSADRSQYETLVRIQELDPRRESRSAFGQQVFSSCLAGWLLELSLRCTSSLVGEVIHGRATTSSTRRHSVMRLPRCPVCLPMQPLTRNPLY